jgi:hypothetical protein
MKAVTAPVLLALLLASLLVSTACGGGSASSTSSPSVTPIAGNWQMTLQETGKMNSSGTVSGFLGGTNDALTGSAAYTATTCAGVGTVTGSVNGSDVTLSVSPTGLNISLTGTLGSDRSSMSGDYILLASGCGKPQTGTWTGNLVQPMTGNLTGNLTSSSTGNPVYPVTAMINQGNGTGASSAPLTGTFTAGSTGSSCFPPGIIVNVSGLISGESVVIGLTDVAGDPLGQITGVWPSLDSTATPPVTKPSLTGTYKIVAQGPKGTPCSKGDSGTVCLAPDATACQASTR